LGSLLVLICMLLGGSLGAQEVTSPDPQETDQDSGILPTLTGISVQGNRRVSTEHILEVFGLQVGAKVSPEDFGRGIDNLYDRFHVYAEVFQAKTGVDRVELRLKIRELPVDLEPRFLGNVKIDADEILEWSGLREGQELFISEAPRIQSRLLNRYRSEGFYFIEIRAVVRAAEYDPNTGEEVIAPDVIFEIKEGPRVQVKRVLVNGNDTFPNSSFLFLGRGLSHLAQVELTTRSWLGIFSDDLVMETLQADLLSMRNVYRDYGYLDAIVELEPLEFSDDRKWVTIHISVDEGGRYTIGSIGFQSFEWDMTNPRSPVRKAAPMVFPEDELLELLEVKVGDTYERRKESTDEAAIRKYYGESGYLGHPSVTLADRWNWLKPDIRIEKDNPVIHLTYNLVQGRQIYIREIRIKGNQHTRDAVIRAKGDVNPGELADPEEIERSRRRIEGTGFFSSRLDPTHIRPTYEFEDTEDPNFKDLVYKLHEGDVITFQISGGISSNNGLFAGIQLNVNNFDISKWPSSFGNTFSEISSRQAFQGGGQTLSLSASPGTEVSQYSVSFRDPDIFGLYREEISLSVFGSKTLRRFSSHDEERGDVGFTVGRALGLDSSIFAGLGFGSVEIDDIGERGRRDEVPDLLLLQEDDLDLAYLRLGYNWRQRDNRLSTRNGFAVGFDNRIYTEALGSDVEFIKSSLNLELWNEFDDDPNIVSSYTHLQLNMGLAYPFGDDDVPYTERFFLGGLRSLRGFRRRGVGPNQEDFPIGGETQIHGTLEYRIPLSKRIQPGTYQETELFQGGFFLDFGVLDPVPGELDLDELRSSVGILFGISVPIPITFSFGFPLQDGEGDRKRVFGFDIGI
jgi:outer membrane protein insertion porin family